MFEEEFARGGAGESKSGGLGLTEELCPLGEGEESFPKDWGSGTSAVTSRQQGTSCPWADLGQLAQALS